MWRFIGCVLLIIFLVIPVGLFFPPAILYPYRSNARPLALVGTLVIIGALVFFLRSVGIGLMLYLVAGAYAVAKKSFWMLSSNGHSDSPEAFR